MGEAPRRLPAAPPAPLAGQLGSDPVTSLYRRHRPQTFDEVVGQTTIVRTMSNAVERRQGPPRLPVRRLARDRQDLDREDPRPLAQLRATGPTLRALRRVRVLRRDRQLDLARRDRDGRRLEQLGRRHPRPAREGRLRPGAGRLEGLHPRRGAHALQRGLERVPEDARGAAAEHDLRARHDRGAQGARRRSSTAATASTSSGRRWRRSRPCSSGSPTRRASRPTTARWR